MSAPALGAVGGVARGRGDERLLLVLVGCALVVGWASLASLRAGTPTLGVPGPIAAWMGAIAVLHGALSLRGSRADQLLLPVVALLGGVSLLLMERLPQSLGPGGALATAQLGWLLLAVGACATIALLGRGDGLLRDHPYTWALVGIGLLAVVLVFGTDVNGARLSVRIGPLAGQPSEILKPILAIVLAGYLADRRALLARDLRLGPLPLPPLPWLVPLLAMLGLAILLVVVQRDLGAALLFYGLFLAMLWTATQRRAWVLGGIALAGVASVVLYGLFAHVRVRVDAWADPWADPLGSGYQALRALFALGRGGIAGTGLGAGLPEVAGVPAMPAIHTDLVVAALGEELGLAGLLALCGCYLVLGLRGLTIAARAGDDFRALLATGLTTVLVLQAALIIGGNLKVVPLTGVTLPFVSYGGSSLLACGICVGLLLALDARREAR
ncbi:MAG: FtsW/RodA/SpoVE family cell cycle protein [Chloroflexota bacterium]